MHSASSPPFVAPAPWPHLRTALRRQADSIELREESLIGIAERIKAEITQKLELLFSGAAAPVNIEEIRAIQDTIPVRPLEETLHSLREALGEDSTLWQDISNSAQAYTEENERLLDEKRSRFSVSAQRFSDQLRRSGSQDASRYVDAHFRVLLLEDKANEINKEKLHLKESAKTLFIQRLLVEKNDATTEAEQLRIDADIASVTALENVFTEQNPVTARLFEDSWLKSSFVALAAQYASLVEEDLQLSEDQQEQGAVVMRIAQAASPGAAIALKRADTHAQVIDFSTDVHLSEIAVKQECYTVLKQLSEATTGVCGKTKARAGLLLHQRKELKALCRETLELVIGNESINTDALMAAYTTLSQSEEDLYVAKMRCLTAADKDVVQKMKQQAIAITGDSNTALSYIDAKYEWELICDKREKVLREVTAKEDEIRLHLIDCYEQLIADGGADLNLEDAIQTQAALQQDGAKYWEIATDDKLAFLLDYADLNKTYLRLVRERRQLLSDSTEFRKRKGQQEVVLLCLMNPAKAQATAIKKASDLVVKALGIARDELTPAARTEKKSASRKVTKKKKKRKSKQTPRQKQVTKITAEIKRLSGGGRLEYKPALLKNIKPSDSFESLALGLSRLVRAFSSHLELPDAIGKYQGKLNELAADLTPDV